MKTKIVVSSFWRVGRSVATLQELLTGKGVICEVIDRTPDLFTLPRGHEIKKWLEGREDVDSFIILDDDSDMVFLELLCRLVHTTFTNGIQDTSVGLSVAILNS